MPQQTTWPDRFPLLDMLHDLAKFLAAFPCMADSMNSCMHSPPGRQSAHYSLLICHNAMQHALFSHGLAYYKLTCTKTKHEQTLSRVPECLQSLNDFNVQAVCDDRGGTLDYLGIPGFRIAGGQGVIVTLRLKVRIAVRPAFFLPLLAVTRERARGFPAAGGGAPIPTYPHRRRPRTRAEPSSPLAPPSTTRPRQGGICEMTESWEDGFEQAPAPESVSCLISRCPISSARRSRQRNIFHLLAQREVSARTKHQAKKHWIKSLKCDVGSLDLEFWSTDARHNLFSWAESKSLHCWSAKYCPLEPTPRSTIAAAFSPDGRTLASTHGDHTVKIIDYQTGKCLKELLGHQRTPWVVRYHPLYSDIVASGSLDHDVRLWDAKTSHCIGVHHFYRPIASIAFHANGELLAVASGHKLFIWDYNKRGEAFNPPMILKTRRSLRAVHFHPHGAPYLLTAEVNNLDLGDSTLTLAKSSGYSNCRPAVIVANINSMHCPHLESRLSAPCFLWPGHLKGDEIICPLCNDQRITSNVQSPLSSLPQNTPSDTENQEIGHTPMDICPGEPGVANDNNSVSTPVYAGSELNTVNVQCDERVHSGRAARYERFSGRCNNIRNQEIVLPSRPTGSSGMPMEPFNASGGLPYVHNLEHLGAWSSVRASTGSFGGPSRHHTSLRHLTASVPGFDRLFLGTQIDEPGVPTSLFDGSGPELPCTVKLKIWRHNIKDPDATLDAEACCLTISHAVLCSEMGTHFSPCGRFLVACVACILPQTEGDHGTQSSMQYDSTGAGTSPTRHPLSSHQVIYELRVYSLEVATFGTVLASRAIKAAHCLTSIQFSPTSEHILLAYGRRHNSLLRTILLDGKTIVPVYSVLEVYRVSDMELVRVLPSASDEVNVACFHPSPGVGLVYGTKVRRKFRSTAQDSTNICIADSYGERQEGKLRILQHNGANMGPDFFAEQNMPEACTVMLNIFLHPMLLVLINPVSCYFDNILEKVCITRGI
ncbi:hypothetical protein EJB05_44768, partial [Eragrostis curvula]